MNQTELLNVVDEIIKNPKIEVEEDGSKKIIDRPVFKILRVKKRVSRTAFLAKEIYGNVKYNVCEKDCMEMLGNLTRRKMIDSEMRKNQVWHLR